MNYYDEIKNKLIDNEVYEKIKDYSKERYRVMIYFEIGKLLYEAEINMVIILLKNIRKN